MFYIGYNLYRIFFFLYINVYKRTNIDIYNEVTLNLFDFHKEMNNHSILCNKSYVF